MEFSQELVSQNSSSQSSCGSAFQFTYNGDPMETPVSTAFRTSRGMYLIKFLHAVGKGIDRVYSDIQHIDAKMAVIAKELNDLKGKKTERGKKDRLKVKPMQHFIAPFFRDGRKRHPPLNFASKDKIARKDYDAYWALAIPWGTAERKLFLKIVHQVAIESVLRPLCLRKGYLEDKLLRDITNEKEKKEVEQAITKLSQGTFAIKRLTLEDIVKHPDCKLDWLLISGQMENFAFARTPDECEKIWNNLLDPKINRQKFTKNEDIKLEQLALMHDERNWKVISCELGTDRTAIQCITRYQSHLNKELIKKYWTEEEDNRLIYYIEKLRMGEYIPWTQVISHMQGRSLLQLQNRWDRCLRPQKRDSNWTTDEDAILVLAVAVIKQPLWAKISSLLYGRTSYYCRERYTNTLDPELLTGAWTVEEDIKLLRCLAEHGEKWGKISRAFPERTDNMVNNRCKIIKRYKAKLYEDILRKGLNYDFSKFPKKQLAPSKVCNDINAWRDGVRNDAFNLAKKVAIKVLGHKVDFSNCHKIKDFGSLLNEASLELIAAELLREQDGDLKRPLLKYHNMSEFDITEMDEESSDEDCSLHLDDDDDQDIDDNIVIKEENDDNYDDYGGQNGEDFILPKYFDLDAFMAEFDQRIFPNAEIGVRNFIPGINFKSKKRYMEYSVVLRHIFQLYGVKVPPDFELDQTKTKYYNIDYTNTVPIVIDMFVMANTRNQSLPIMPPNLTTLKGGKMLLMIYRHLSKWMENLDEEDCNMYNSFAASASNGKILCTYCSQRLDCEIQNKQTNQSMDICIKSESLCTCETVLEIRQKWRSFLYRFTTMFIWPQLLCAKGPSSRQLLNRVIIPARIHTETINNYLKNRKRKNRGFSAYYSDLEEAENGCEDIG